MKAHYRMLLHILTGMQNLCEKHTPDGYTSSSIFTQTPRLQHMYMRKFIGSQVPILSKSWIVEISLSYITLNNEVLESSWKVLDQS